MFKHNIVTRAKVSVNTKLIVILAIVVTIDTILTFSLCIERLLG